MSLSLTITNGRIYTPEGLFEGAVHASGGVVDWIGKDSGAPKADELLDAKGLLVLPGLIDAHCHMRDLERSSFEDFESGTKSAAAGGITTIFDMPTTIPPTSSPFGFQKKKESAKSKAVVDFGLYGGAGGTNIPLIRELADLGAIGFKTFTMVYPGREKDMDGLITLEDYSMFEILKEVAKTGLFLSIHAENHEMLSKYQEEAERKGGRSLLSYVEGRPPVVEAEVAVKAFYLGYLAGARANIAHVSAGDTVGVIRFAKQNGVLASGETCPHYLTFTAEELNGFGAYGKVAPPVRNKVDREKLWAGVNDGTISMVVSDHAPFNKEMKERGRDNVFLAQAGMTGLQAMVGVMLTHLNNGRVTLDRLVEVMSTNPSRMGGIYPRKGVIGLGADADFTVVDPTREWTIKIDEFHTKHRDAAAPYDGFKAKGKALYTVVRGKIVAREAVVEAEAGYGEMVRPLGPHSEPA
jgi:allantoinase